MNLNASPAYQCVPQARTRFLAPLQHFLVSFSQLPLRLWSTHQALTEFGIAGLSLRALIDFLKTALKNSNAAVRSSATAALVTVKLFAGPGETS